MEPHDTITQHIEDALDLVDELPKSREASLVRTKLEEARMWLDRVPLGA